MPGPLAEKNIVSACNAGIIEAHNHYVTMSGGDWLWHAPEYFITTFIALEIHKQPGTKRVVVEHGTKRALQDAGAIGQGKIHRDIRVNGRVDIVISWADGTPRGIIEVKNRIFNKSQYEKDVQRIARILKRKASESSITFGIFSFYTVTSDSSRGTADENADLRKEIIETNMREILGKDFAIKLAHNPFSYEDKWAAHAMTALIKYKPT